MTDNGIKCAWIIHESKALQTPAGNIHCYLHVPQVSGSINKDLGDIVPGKMTCV